MCRILIPLLLAAACLLGGCLVQPHAEAFDCCAAVFERRPEFHTLVLENHTLTRQNQNLRLLSAALGLALLFALLIIFSRRQ